MIFWIFTILAVLGIMVAVATSIISNNYKSESSNKFVKFVYCKDVIIKGSSITVSTVSGIIAAIMLIVIICNQMLADGSRARNEQRYKALIYKAQTESIRDEFGIVNKEYIDEVQSWNEYVAKYQAYSNDFWIGIFYPDRQYEGLKTINLEDIKIRN